MKYTNGMYLFLSLIFTATTKLQSFLMDRAKTKHWDITTIATKLDISDERYVQLRDVRDPWEQLDDAYLSISTLQCQQCICQRSIRLLA